MNILFVSWEVDPFFKVGGLGDIARSLPKALHNKNIDISLAVPLYDAVKFHGQETTEVGQVSIVYDGKKITFHIEFLILKIMVMTFMVIFFLHLKMNCKIIQKG